MNAEEMGASVKSLSVDLLYFDIVSILLRLNIICTVCVCACRKYAHVSTITVRQCVALLDV